MSPGSMVRVCLSSELEPGPGLCFQLQAGGGWLWACVDFVHCSPGLNDGETQVNAFKAQNWPWHVAGAVNACTVPAGAAPGGPRRSATRTRAHSCPA